MSKAEVFTFVSTMVGTLWGIFIGWLVWGRNKGVRGE